MKIERFDIQGDRLDLVRQFEKWIERFERELLYNGVDITDKAELAKMALLIYAGPDVEDIYATLSDPPKPENITEAAWTVYVRAKGRLMNHFMPQKCNDFALHQLISLRMSMKE